MSSKKKKRKKEQEEVAADIFATPEQLYNMASKYSAQMNINVTMPANFLLSMFASAALDHSTKFGSNANLGTMALCNILIDNLNNMEGLSEELLEFKKCLFLIMNTANKSYKKGKP